MASFTMLVCSTINYITEIDCFTIWDRDRLIGFESILRYYMCNIISIIIMYFARKFWFHSEVVSQNLHPTYPPSFKVSLRYIHHLCATLLTQLRRIYLDWGKKSLRQNCWSTFSLYEHWNDYFLNQLNARKDLVTID